MKKRTFSTGAVSILLIFIVLCLVAFGVLACATSQAGYKYAQTAAEHTISYYSACTQAEEQISGLTENLVSAWESDPLDYSENISTGSYSPYLDGTLWSETEGCLTLSVVITEAKQLTVNVRPLIPEQGEYLKILSYSTMPSGQWEADDTLSLLGGT